VFSLSEGGDFVYLRIFYERDLFTYISLLPAEYKTFYNIFKNCLIVVSIILNFKSALLEFLKKRGACRALLEIAGECLDMW
jgi:hypothetical protein